MLGFSSTDAETAIEMRMMRRIRPRVVGLTDTQRRQSRRLYEALISPNEKATLTEIFSLYSFKEGEDSYPLYTVLYNTEHQITHWETLINAAWKKRRDQLIASLKTKEAEMHKSALEMELAECNNKMSENEAIAQEKRERLYEGFFEYLYTTYADNPTEITRIVNGITAWDPVSLDPVHARLVNHLFYHRKIRQEQAAYQNEWYMPVIGAAMSLAGIICFTLAMATGLLPMSYIGIFAFLAVAGLGIAIVGMTKEAAQNTLHYRANTMATTKMRSTDRIMASQKLKERYGSIFSYLNWRSAALLFIGAGFLGIMIADVYTGGIFGAIGHTLNLTILPEWDIYANTYHNASIPNVNVPILGEYFLNPIIYALNFIYHTVASSFLSIFSHTAINFMVVGAIGTAGLDIISRGAALSTNKTLTRVHTAIDNSYKSVLTVYGLCGTAAFGFGGTLIPMLLLPIPVCMFIFFAYKRFVQGEVYWSQDMSHMPPMLGGGPGKTKEHNCNKGLALSGIAVACLTVTAFSLFANPFTFSVAFVLLAVVVGIAQYQIRSDSNMKNRELSTETLIPVAKNASDPIKPSAALAAVNKTAEKAKQTSSQTQHTNSASTATGLNLSKPQQTMENGAEKNTYTTKR